jgi:hypothetical protein
MKFIGFFAMSLTRRAESNRLITHFGIRRVYGFWAVSVRIPAIVITQIGPS